MPTDVVIESSLGPQRGHYHNTENGTWLGGETVTQDEAEEAGYTRCRSCFPDQEVMADAAQ